IRWCLGTAIKSWLRAGPYPANHKQKDAAPKKSDGGVAPEEGEENEAHDWFAHDDGADAPGGHIGGDGGERNNLPARPSLLRHKRRRLHLRRRGARFYPRRLRQRPPLRRP